VPSLFVSTPLWRKLDYTKDNPVAPDHSWKTAIKIMEEKIEELDPEKYERKGTIQTHWVTMYDPPGKLSANRIFFTP